MTNDIAIRLQKLVTAPGPAQLGPAARSGTLSALELEGELKPMRLPATAHALVKAVLLLWHDHLNASHTISQGIENRDGSLIHAIMHRREPDYWNSKYWWRRVGEHPCFGELGKSVTDLLQAQGEAALAGKLVARGSWNASAFVEACESVAGKPGDSPRVQLLREIQQLETQAALRHFLRDYFSLEFALP